jgi:outer membrane protein OmpA-like peptidoglycan-associated protein
MFQSKTLVYLLFALWSFVCWRWYVCGIKQVCGTQTVQENPIRKVEETPAIEADTLPANTAAPSTASGKAPASNGTTKPFASNEIDKVQLEEVEDRMVIHFPYNSVRKEDNAAIDEYLTRLAASLKGSKQTVYITGHTDFVGDSKTNYTFGLKRANSIREILVKKGVAKTQIKCASKGDTKPVATNDTPQGRYRNRRAEIRVKP